jgi:CRP-like cAMP-binding protein
VDPAGILLQTPIFGDLGVADVEELLPELRTRHYARGEVVWLEGDPATELYVVAAGQLKSHRVSPEGREVILSLHGAPSVTGEIGLFHPRAIRWVTVSAMLPTTCLTFGRTPLLAFLSRHPPAMKRMLEQLSVTAVQTAYSFSGMAFDDLGRRVATALLVLADQHGSTPTADGLRIDVRLSQSDLAGHVAASRENVNRALSRFVTRRVVSQRGGHFYLHDRAALERAARAEHDWDRSVL